MHKTIISLCFSLSTIILSGQTSTVTIDADSTNQTIEGFGATTLPLVYGTVGYTWTDITACSKNILQAIFFLFLAY